MKRIAAGLIVLALTASSWAQQAPWYGGAASGTAYPNFSIPITASMTGTTGTVSATLPGVTGKTTFLCGFAMTSAGSGMAASGMGAVTGTISGTMNFAFETPNGQGILVVPFRPCIPANAANTPIVVTQPAGGAGTTAAVTAWGYQL